MRAQPSLRIVTCQGVQSAPTVGQPRPSDVRGSEMIDQADRNSRAAPRNQLAREHAEAEFLYALGSHIGFGGANLGSEVR